MSFWLAIFMIFLVLSSCFYIRLLLWSPIIMERNTDSRIREIFACGIRNRPFYRYGGHIESVRFKEYQGAWARLDILTQYLRALFGPIFLKVFLEKSCNRQKDRCDVFGCNINDHFFPEKYTVKFSFCPKGAHKCWAGAPWTSYNTPYI